MNFYHLFLIFGVVSTAQGFLFGGFGGGCCAPRPRPCCAPPPPRCCPPPPPPRPCCPPRPPPCGGCAPLPPPIRCGGCRPPPPPPCGVVSSGCAGPAPLPAPIQGPLPAPGYSVPVTSYGISSNGYVRPAFARRWRYFFRSARML